MSSPVDPDSSDWEPAPGVLVTSNIRLERQLGKGGMGSVWAAEHLTLKTRVVVKFMGRGLASSPEARLRFEREATLAAQARSPHVVQIFDHGVSAFGLPYIAMEYLEGEDLGQRIARSGAIPPPLFAGWLAQICRGLSRAHAKNITHRDIKPENLFLCEEDGQTLLKILDFGVAKHESQATAFSGTQTGTMLGTAYYMSPEQTLGQRDVDHRTDLWALAVVTYYALTGTRPFDGATLGALAIEITSGRWAPPSAKNRSLGAGVDAWMTKALSRPRELRFESAKEMSEAFDAALRLDALGTTLHDSGSGDVAPPRTLLSNGAQLSPAPSTMAPSIQSTLPLGERTARPRSKVAAWLGLASLALLLGIALLVWRRSSSMPVVASPWPSSTRHFSSALRADAGSALVSPPRASASAAPTSAAIAATPASPLPSAALAPLPKKPPSRPSANVASPSAAPATAPPSAETIPSAKPPSSKSPLDMQLLQ